MTDRELLKLSDTLATKGIPPEQCLDYARGILSVGNELAGLPQEKMNSLLLMLIQEADNFKDRHFVLIDVFQTIVEDAANE